MSDYDYERAELYMLAAAAKRHHAELDRHPDCRDPDHPGCEHCDPVPDQDSLTKLFKKSVAK